MDETASTQRILALLQEMFQKITEDERSCDDLHKNIPLYEASRIERLLRRWALNREGIASKLDQFFLAYAQRNSHILTPDAQAVVKRLTENRGIRIYIVELNVPSVREGIVKHITDIDLVAFLPMIGTMRILDYLFVRPLGLNPFSKPAQKGSAAYRYWSSQSVTHRQEKDRHRITDIKFRSRIRGSGYSLSKKQVKAIQDLGFDHILSAFMQ